MKKIDALKALNPDVTCQACITKRCKGGGKCDWSGADCSETSNCGEFDPIDCYLCKNKRTVSLTKAQEYQIKQLEAEIEWLKESFYNTL